MAERVLQHTATIPAGTPAATPATVALPFDNWQVEAIDLQVLPGPQGVLGFQLANNGRPWIPREAGEWLVWDDHRELFAVADYPTASGWQVTGYNTGAYDHAVIVRFHVNPIDLAAVAPLDLPVLTFIERDVASHAVVL